MSGEEYAKGLWDVLVIGAGPAGSAAAISAARAGLEVCLVDAKAFPRRKVCGGCLNRVSTRLLADLLGREHPFWESTIPIDSFQLLHGHRRFRFALPPGVAIDRQVVDHCLTQVAQELGVTFCAPISARLMAVEKGCRQVELRSSGSKCTVCAKVVIVAAGLGNQVAGIETSLRSTAAFESRVGIEAIYSHYPAAYTPGTIHMAVSGPGYVGLTQIAGKLLHVAAAVDRRVLQETGPEQLTQIILRGAGAPELLPDSEVTWRGTPPLTSSAMRLAAERVFVVGDAARYVEPFTGEGIRWALQTGIGVTPFAVAACQAWQAKLIQHWEAWYSQHIATEQRLCRRLTTGLKSPIVRWVGHQALRLGPGLAASVIARLNQES